MRTKNMLEYLSLDGGNMFLFPPLFCIFQVSDNEFKLFHNKT